MVSFITESKLCADIWSSRKNHSHVVVDGRQGQVSHFDVPDGVETLGGVGLLAARRRNVEADLQTRV